MPRRRIPKTVDNESAASQFVLDLFFRNVMKGQNMIRISSDAEARAMQEELDKIIKASDEIFGATNAETIKKASHRR